MVRDSAMVTKDSQWTVYMRPPLLSNGTIADPYDLLFTQKKGPKCTHQDKQCKVYCLLANMIIEYDTNSKVPVMFLIGSWELQSAKFYFKTRLPRMLGSPR